MSDNHTIDLSHLQREIAQQLADDEAYLMQLEREAQQVQLRLAAHRGKLDLIAQLARDYAPPTFTHSDAPTAIDGGEKSSQARYGSA